jgi:retron-type reverse transcriptase
VEIPKEGGKVRQLSIPSIRDRVVQGALKLILEPIFEADFQPGSSEGAAVAELCAQKRTWREITGLLAISKGVAQRAMKRIGTNVLTI